jgi:hypothetical protein
MLWLLLAACTAPSTIQLGGQSKADTGGPPAGPLVGDTAAELLPGDTSSDTGDPVEADDPDLYEPGEIMELTIELDRDAYSALARDGHEYVEAVLGWDGRRWPVAIHIKGSSSWQDISDKPSLVVDVNRVDDKQKFRGTKKFYLHNDCYDPSQMSETLSYGFYREWGYPASRTSFAHLTLDGRDYGLYTVTEPHEDPFLETWFADPNGNLYENRDAYCDVDELRCMEIEQSDEGSDEAIGRLGVASKLTGAAWRPAMEPLLNWEQFIDYLALEITVVHWDSYSYDLSNYSFYHEPSTDQWTFLTQSMDLDFGYRPWSYADCGKYGMDIDKYTMGALAKSCHQDASCKAELVARVAEYADLLEAADGAARVRELDAFIGDAVKADPRRYWDDDEYDTHVACLQEFFEERPDQLRAWVAAQVD